MKEELKHIIESLLFVSDTPLSVQKIKMILDLRRPDVILESLHKLAQEYEERKGGFYLSEAAGGYQLRTRPEYKEWIQRMVQNRPARLSRAAMETLAIIAYKQPVIRSDVEYIRGVDCGGVLRVLLERKIIRVMGRKEIPGRPMIYGTTHKFLEMFGLKDLKDLPTPKEIEELNKADAENPYDLINAQHGSDSNFEMNAYSIFPDDMDKIQAHTSAKLRLSRNALYCRNRNRLFRRLKKMRMLPKRFLFCKKSRIKNRRIVQKLKPGCRTFRNSRADRRLTRKKI